MTLRQRYEEAKALGEAVNGARACINALKARVETCRQKRAAAGVADGGGGELPSPEEEALVAELDGEKRKYKEGFAKLRELKGEIEHLQHLLEQARGPATLCTRPTAPLHGTRPPSHPTTPYLTPASPLPREQSRRKLQQDFERWFAAQEASKVDPGADAAPLAAALPGGMGGVAQPRQAWNSPVRARASPSKGGGGSSLPSPTKPPPAGAAGGGGGPALTGDSEVDREILAFYNARRTLGVERAAAR